MMKRRLPRFRQLHLPVIATAILWLVSVTATSHSATHALEALGTKKELALTLLRTQLGDYQRYDNLPTAAALAIAQSPLLLSGHDAILELRRSEEEDNDTTTQQPSLPEQSTPIPEDIQEPETPLLMADNGVSAKTLVAASPKGYIVSGDVYIDNRSDRTFDETIFDGTFHASLIQSDAPQVLIVHTHGSEAYTMPAGQEYIPSGEFRTTDENFSVIRVGAEIAAVLEQHNIHVLHAPILHDYPEYSGAYNRSLKTVEDYLEQYPSISLVLDVHRDAVSDKNGTMYKIVSNVAGLNAAQMSFVIGTDGGGLSHPLWQENLKLAAAIQQTLCDDYPTLMRPITVRNSRYNQHTTTGSLLVEMGAAGNSLDEALFSARLLANAIVHTMLTPESDSLPIAQID